MKKNIIIYLSILFFISCHKNVPETPTNQCNVFDYEKPCFQFIDEVERLGVKVDSSVYLNKIVGKWKLHCGRVVPIKQFCDRYSLLDTINYSINFKSDFTYEYSSDTIQYQGKIQNFSKEYSDSLRFSFSIDLVTNNKLKMYAHPSSYNSIYMIKM